VLLGLTATPERTDGEDILHYFDGHIAAEMRLWDALERTARLPVPVLRRPRQLGPLGRQVDAGGYDVGDLEKLYTGNDARVRWCWQQLRTSCATRTMRALGFCVSVAHAEFMARRFTEAGLPSLAVSADTDSDDRARRCGPARRRVRALFAVDLFNEGVDLPEVDTLLFLRPTESALVFLQQLGRGLRRHEGKDCVTVLDFIGQAHRQFRFDLRYRAITGATRARRWRSRSSDGFPFLPAGCSMQLDRVATDIVLKNIRQAIPSRRPAMERELRHCSRPRSSADECRRCGSSWTRPGWRWRTSTSPALVGLKRAAGVAMPRPARTRRSLATASSGCCTSTTRCGCGLHERARVTAVATSTSRRACSWRACTSR
jgi:hypothetical protein